MYEVIMCAIANAMGILQNNHTGPRIYFTDHFKDYEYPIVDVVRDLALVHWFDQEDQEGDGEGYYGIIWEDESGTLNKFLIRISDKFDMVTTTHILSRVVVAHYEKLKKEKEKENEGM